MPSAQECAERLREQAYRTLLPQIRDLEKELQDVSNSLSSGINQLGQKLEALSHVELPTTESVLAEILGNVTREADLNAGALAVFAQNLRKKETQEEILNLFLDTAQRFFPVTALFVVRGSRYIGWSSRGFSESVSRSLGISEFARSECPKFDEVLEGGIAVACPDLLEQCPPLQFLPIELTEDCRLVPLCVLDRPVAVILVAGTASAPGGADALSILAELSVLRLENISLRILYELTAARRETVEPVQTANEAQQAPGNVPAVAEPQPAVFQAAAQSEAAPVHQTESVFDFEKFQNTARGVETESRSTPGEISFAPPVEQPEPVLVLEPAPPKISVQESRPEEEKLHSEAKRFARLLVSEIKLYNEHHVTEGRESRDLYLRLKRDIDRSREMYEKRVSPTVSRKIDYFHDEIIRILGDNDPSTLGSDYPGPRVES